MESWERLWMLRSRRYASLLIAFEMATLSRFMVMGSLPATGQYVASCLRLLIFTIARLHCSPRMRRVPLPTRRLHVFPTARALQPDLAGRGVDDVVRVSHEPRAKSLALNICLALASNLVLQREDTLF